MCRVPRFAAVAATGILLGALNSQAAVRTWDGGGDPDFNWSNPLNWDGDGSAPAAGDHLIFSGTAGLINNNDLAVDTTFLSVTFASGAGSFVLQGNAIKLGTGGDAGVTNSSANLQTFDLEAKNNRTTRYDTTGASIINTKRLWDWRYYKHGPNDLILNQTLAGMNGEILGVTGGRVILNGLVAGPIGHGVTIDSGGTVVSAGPADQISSGRDVVLNGGVFQVQNTNALGEPFLEEIAMLRSSAAGAVVENGSALGPIFLEVGGGGNRRGAYDGILQDGGAGDLAFRVKNAGTWIALAGNSTYSGPTEVTNSAAGITRLLVNGQHTGGGEYTIGGSAPGNQAVLGGGGSIAATAVNVNAQGVLAPGGQLGGTLYTKNNNSGTFSESIAALTLDGAVSLTDPTSTLDIHLGGTSPGTQYDQVVIAGGGSFSNNNANLQLTVDLGFAPAGGEKFTLVQVQGTDSADNIGAFASLNGIPTDLSQGATFLLGAAQFRISYRAEGGTFDAGAGNGNDIMVEAMASTAADLSWRGDVSSDWDVQTTANWRDGANAASTFTNLDKVAFTDAGVATNVNLTTDLNPSTILVDAAKDYFFTGPGKLTGGIVLTKTNSGTLTLLTENDFGGSTVIDRGVLQIGDNGFQGALSSSIIVNSNGVLAFNRADDQVFGPAAFSGTGKLVHNGSGMLTITTDYSLGFNGITTNSGGTLQFGDGTTAGNAGRFGGLIHVPASKTVQYNFGGTVAQTIPNSLSGAGAVILGYGSGGQTITFGATATNTGFTGTMTVKPYTRLDVSAAAATPSGPIVVESDGSGGNGSYYTHVGGLTNQNPISIAGPGPGGASGPIDTPRGKGALRLGNAWAGPITLTGNATIGASAGTGTVLGNISDGGSGFVLEYIGGTIQVGPATGLNSYGVTLITEDLIGSASTSGQTTVRALNSNPFSSAAVQMVGQTRLELNGNNVSIANLVDLSSVSAVSNFPPLVLNNSAVAPAVLTLGSDNDSQTFGGRFGNGGSQPLGLTKVGAGVFTVVGDSTNTGPVTVSAGTLALAESTAFYPNGQPVVGSGSFSNASVIAVSQGATLDVMGRLDQRLTLNANQTLTGSGTLNGSLTAAPGSVINPGDAVGTLTVSGSAVLSGVLLMDLNRTAAPNNSDRLVATGGITYGGTLAVTNVGPALQVGDFFQLFTTGVAGFTGFALQTDDLVNNVKYTWNNTVAADGRVTVASVSPLVNVNPTNIVTSVANGQLTLSWPEDHIGWTLQVQTNSLAVGLGDNWVSVPGSETTNEITVPVSTTEGAIFYRLVYP